MKMSKRNVQGTKPGGMKGRKKQYYQYQLGQAKLMLRFASQGKKTNARRVLLAIFLPMRALFYLKLSFQ